MDSRSANETSAPGVNFAIATRSAVAKAVTPVSLSSFTTTRTESEASADAPAASSMRICGVAGSGVGVGGTWRSCEPAPGMSWASAPWLNASRASGNSVCLKGFT